MRPLASSPQIVEPAGQTKMHSSPIRP
jgi:hypothetical protein